MLNRAWIDPRDVDWTDALNGVANPGLRRNNNPAGYAAVNDQFMLALRLAKGIEPRIFVCPEPANQSIPPGTTFDYEVPSEPNSWLWAMTVSIQNFTDLVSGDGLLVQVTDSSTGATLFSQPTNSNELTGLPIIGGTPTKQGSGNGYRGPLFLLPTPHLYEPPSYPVVRMVNTSTATTMTVRVTLYTVAEYDA